MRILIFNWRDKTNPSGGGAEILTQQLAKHWVSWGHTVTIFTSGFQGARPQECLDGVNIIRRGRWWNVHALALIYYFFRFRSETDVIIDEVHWYPFFAAVYARKKTVLLACEVAYTLFPVLFAWPLSVVGRGIEKIYFRLYRNIPTIAISESTKNDLIAAGFKSSDITVIPLGISAPSSMPKVIKEHNPTLVYLGRVNKQKGIEDALTAFFEIRNTLPLATLWVIGGGTPVYKSLLQRRARALGIMDAVRFFGHTHEKDKFALLAKAHVLIFPSAHEGWGLVVHEAGVVATPTIAYNVPGTKDAVQNGKSGVLTEPEPHMLARAAIRVLTDTVLYKKLQAGAIAEAKQRDWDIAARIALEVLKRI